MIGYDPIWQAICEDAEQAAKQEPILASHLQATILNHEHLESALSFHLAQILHSPIASSLLLKDIIDEAFNENIAITRNLRYDLRAYVERDPACDSYLAPFLYFKGFHALQTYRVANWLWQHNRSAQALLLQSLVACEFSVDIHPAACIGHGILIDHATGIVIGETAVLGNNISLMQAVTLGGTGKDSGDRHPKVGDGVLIGAGAKILGNLIIGEGAKICAGSVVLQEVLPHTTVVGVPAKAVGHPDCEQPALAMNQCVE